MNRWMNSGWVALSALAGAVSVAALGLTLVACEGRLPAEQQALPAAPAAAASAAAIVAAATPAAAANVAAPATKEPAPAAIASPRSLTSSLAPQAAVPEPAASATPGAATVAAASKLIVKRFVVTTAVEDCEPALGGNALPSDGKPIFAFAELQNPGAEPENVRITFERKGSSERAGNATLPVPANTSRHRTWAKTSNIRAAGVWEAVLWSESGSELSRTSFEVADS